MFEGVFQGSFGLVDLLQVQEGDALIQACDRQPGIELGGLLKGLESLLEELLVHVGSPEIVQARGLRWICFRLILRGGREYAKRCQEYAGKSG